MRAIVIVAACVLALGCTRANLGYGGGGNGGSGGLGGSGGTGGVGGTGGGPIDLSATSTHDMVGGAADLQSASTDLGSPQQCSAGQRRCITLVGLDSEGCGAGGHWQLDRRCPYGSGNKTGAACANGYCEPPTTNGTTSCDTGGPLEQVCSQMSAGQGQKFSCQPFISDPTTNPAGVAWWCAVAANAGAGIAGSTCTLGSQCHTGFCASNGTCFWACQNTGECLTATLKCADVTIRVEGNDVTAMSCIPN